MKKINSARESTTKIKRENGRVTISNIFAGQRSKGLTPNEHGWYKMWGGAFNTNNARGDWYPLDPKLEAELTTPNSDFNLRMANGVLGGECNHPDLHLLPNKKAQMMRLNKIDKTRECLQIMQIELDTKTYCNPDNSPVTGVWVWVKPTGAYGEAFKKALEDKDIQVALSLRTESANTLRPNMTWVRKTTKIIGWDWVDIQGLPNATKFESYSMESMFDIDEVEYDSRDVAEIEKSLDQDGHSMEDYGDCLASIKRTIADNVVTAPTTNRSYDF